MPIGRELATKGVDQTVSLIVGGNYQRTAGFKPGFPARIAATLRRVIESRAPFGCEVEAGFHNGASSADWFFTI